MKPLMIIFLTFIVAGCGNNKEMEVETAPENTQLLNLTNEQLKSIPITLTSVQEKPISQTLKLTGKIDLPPQHVVSVSAALGGYVKYIRLLPGMSFRKGDLLATIEDNQYIQLQQDYLTTKLQLKHAETEFLRQKELNESKAVSDKVLQKSEIDYQTLQISLRALKEKLKLIHINPDQLSASSITSEVNIYAPFDGYVTQVNVNTGKYISPSDILFELENLSNLHLSLKVFEKDLVKLKQGQLVTAYTNNNPQKKYTGKVQLIGKSISAEKSVEVHVHLEGNKDELIPGLYMNADIQVISATSMAVPEECVLSFEGKSYVFVKKNNNEFEMIPVTTGSAGNGWIEIENYTNLQNQEIIKEGAYTLLMALKNKSEE